MRTTVTQHTAVEGVRTFPDPDDHDAVILGQDSLAAVVIDTGGTLDTAAAMWDTLMSHRTSAGFVDPAWRRRALDPIGEGVSERFRYPVVDMTGRLVVGS